MLVESLIKETVEVQGFRVVAVQQTDEGLEAKLMSDGRYAPRCGRCGRRACRFRHVPLWGIDVHLVYAPRRVVCEHCGGIHVELLSWVAGKRQFTRALMVTLATWAWVLTWK